MDVNWNVIAVVAILVLILVVLTIRKNLREKKKLENLLNNDFKKAQKDDVDADDAANEK
ncbi:MAG: FeoB-associated Cys-rich membrane protein [Flavobacterium sp.]|uniref:FeoB-associated Cys-rich membrane protein n=1 Tax=Flavobacterium sp. TaxID=239 RepID=UPI001B18B27E|nr:FeoB-associated Cys-rich membrane protein [Flavobacterium sp.]MBO9582632.1 FeoB-associated Cys-rich membrane protein [Flavobacterium sp.]